MQIKQFRDLTIISFDSDNYIALSCDSCGGIGEKELDIVKAPFHITAYQTAKVAFAELMCMGFKPIVLTNGLCVEMNNSGKQLINGFNQAIKKLKTTNVHLTGSTEENIKTLQTAMGITCLGVCNKDNIKYKKTKKGDLCILSGLPMVGHEVLENPNIIMDLEDYESLYNLPFIKEMIPVGSKGIDFEIKELCNTNNINFKYNNSIDIDVKKSGGPSCCCIISIDECNIHNLESITTKPLYKLGCFY